LYLDKLLMTGPDIDGYSALGAQFSAGGGLGHAAQITKCAPENIQR